VPGTSLHSGISDARGPFVPALRVEHTHGLAPSLTEQSASQTWRSRAGRIVACGGRDPRGCWMTWPHLATYHFSPEQPEIVAYPEPHAPADVVWDTYRRSVLPMAMHARGWEALHASAVLCADGLVAFCAVSETGKSSVAYGLARRGFTQWADDAVVFASEPSAVAVPLPFEVRLRDSASHLFDGPLPLPQRFTSNGSGDQRHLTPVPVHAIFVLERQPNRPAPLVERVEPHAAFRALLTHAHEFDPSDAQRRAQLLEAYLTIVDRVPIYRVVFEATHGSIAVLLDAIINGLALERSSVQMVTG